jgi:membrane protease YdiL (CAAX protease family)
MAGRPVSRPSPPSHPPPIPAQNQPRWRGTLLYPCTLVGLFLLGQVLLAALGVPEGQRPAIGALPALLALLVSLPLRLRGAWGTAEPWRTLGLRTAAGPGTRALLGGLGQAVLLLALVAVALATAGALHWQPRLTAGLLLNGILLGLGVAFAEELLFRGWLLGELTLLIGGKRALALQAAVFALVHLRTNLPPLLLLGLLGGLLLLGLALGLRRRADQGLLWGAIGLHAALVGGWFVMQQGLFVLSPQAPAWLMGPANPIGGLAGWLGLCLLVAGLRAQRPRANQPRQAARFR